MSTPEEIKAEYTSSLADLTFNSKPLINVLTMLADENSPNAKVIVEAIETHLSKVPIDVKLPILYLIDCIVKNVGGTYTTLFSQNIVSIFCGVFTAVDEKTRAEMFKLRQTWNEVFPQKKLYAIDVQVNLLDPAWPVTAQPPSNSIYFNPKFLQTNTAPSAKNKTETQPSQMITANATNVDKETLLMQEKLIQKQKVLLELQQKKLELEVLQEQIKHNVPVVPVAGRPQNILLKPEVAKQLVPNLNRKGNAIVAPLAPKLQPAANNGTRINPVSSDLIAAAAGGKPAIRDPRLMRQQQKSNVAVANQQPVRDKARKTRADPRLLNKDDAKLRPSVKKADSPGGQKNEAPPSSSPTKQKKKKAGGEKNQKRDRPEGVKGAPKNRNYVRRLVASASPEPRQDEDLRSLGPPEKQPRLQVEVVEEQQATNIPKMVPAAKGMDVDLRQLPTTIVGKKRPSIESPDHSSSKKSKSEILDKLFGDEDTDLRRLPLEQPPIVAEIRPPTPPPPIISSNDSPKEKPRKKDSPQKSNLDAVRAKLANATNRDKVMSKSFNKKKLRATEDQDLRFPKPSSAAAINSAKIIISPEDENNIKHGNLTQEQSKQLLQKIVMQMEKNKLIEAKKKDKEDSFNVSLQPISDEDLVDSEDDNEEKRDEPKKAPVEEQVREESLIPFKDKDERLNVASAPPMQQPPPPFFARFSGGWRGGRRPWSDHGPRMPWGPPNHHHQQQQPPWRGDQLPDGAVDEDEVKSIAIDGVQKDIRFYGETGIVFVDWDDPRELTFQDDGARRVTFNEHESFVLGFNRPYEEVTVNGAAHSVRIGAPSREIFIDRVPYECFFGSAGIRIDLGGVPTTVKLEGPPPPVKIGEARRSDVVAGKIKLFIDAKVVVPVFLDARVQKFVVDGQPNTLKFVNALESVLINDVLFNVEYGGLPKPIVIRGKKHFVRFSVLPKGVRPGRVSIAGMEGPRGSEPPDDNSRDSTSDPYDPALPIVGAKGRPRDVDSPDRNSSGSPNTFQSIMQQQNLNNLDALSNAMTILGPTMPTRGSYQVENQPGIQGASSGQHQGPPAVPSLNINDLFQKLVASGFVTSSEAKKPAAVVAPVGKIVAKKPTTETVSQPDPSMAPSQNVALRLKKSIENLRPVSFKKPEQLRIRQKGLYDILFSGMQCSSCGMRFPTDASIQYSQHLDWHFRQNRKGKRNSRVATSRRWNYSLSDWKNYEEVEDLEEREKNFFDQQKQAEGAAEEDELEAEVPSVAADPESTTESCAVCHDKFDQFFNEEKEEWHLRNAIRMEEKTYHPICFEDYQQSLMDQTADESQIESVEEKQDDHVIPGLEIVIDDDEDDEENHDDKDMPEVVSLENEEVVDDEDSRPADPVPEEEDDDDVILNEVAPIKIVVDDDDEEMPSEEISSNPDSVNVKRESLDDGFIEVSSVSLQNGKQIKIKSEPIDPDDDQQDNSPSKDLPAPTLDPPTPRIEMSVSTPHLDQVSSIDGNLELASNLPVAMPANITGGNRIRINISKPIPAISKEKEVPAETSNASVAEAPVFDALELFPPGEEPAPAALKSALRGLQLKKLPPVSKGKELTGLCSIM